VQRELAAVIALKARKSAIEQDEENSDKHVIVTEAGGVPDSQGGTDGQTSSTSQRKQGK